MRTLTLKRGGLTSWDDGSPFVLPGDLEVTLAGDVKENGEYVTVVSGNGGKYTYKGTNITIPSEILVPGTLELTVTWLYKGVEMMRYRVDELLITEADGQLSATPEMTAVNTEITALTARIAALEESLARVQKEAQELGTGVTSAMQYTDTVKAELTRRMDLIEGEYDPLRV